MMKIVWLLCTVHQYSQTITLVVLIPPDYLRIRFIVIAATQESITVGLIYAFSIDLLCSVIIYVSHIRSINSRTGKIKAFTVLRKDVSHIHLEERIVAHFVRYPA